MAIHNKSHFNSALISINKVNKEKIDDKKDINIMPSKSIQLLMIKDCLEGLKLLPDKSIQLICIDPPYNLDLEDWDTYDNYMDWCSKWLEECWRILKDDGNLIIFGGTQFRNKRSGDLTEIIYHCRHNTQWKLVNTIVWYYKNGMSAQRYFANRHEEIIWLTKTDKYYFNLDEVRVPYNDEDLKKALKDKRLNPENVKKGKNPTNVWEIGRLNGNSLERVGHPTQKPLELIRRIVKGLSSPNSVVLDFFAGSGTTGRVCIEEGRHCILIDKNKTTKQYFDKHLKNMKQTPKDRPYSLTKSIEEFWTLIN